MKWVALLLLIANMVAMSLFLWMQNQASSEAMQYSPLNSSKIILLNARLTNDEPEVPVAVATHTEAICVEWRGMTEKTLERSREAVKKMTAQRVLSIEEQPIERMYWVVFPPLSSATATKAKLSELAALKVKDALLVKDGLWKNGISLGLFSTEEAARSHMRELETQGISGLRLETKPKHGTSYYFVVKSEDATVLRELDEIRGSFPDTTLIRVACKK